MRDFFVKIKNGFKSYGIAAWEIWKAEWALMKQHPIISFVLIPMLVVSITITPFMIQWIKDHKSDQNERDKFWRDFEKGRF